MPKIGDVIVFKEQSDMPGALGIIVEEKSRSWFLVDVGDMWGECLCSSEFDVIDHIDLPLCDCGCGKLATKYLHEDCFPTPPPQEYYHGGWTYHMEQTETKKVYLIRKCDTCHTIEKGYPDTASFS